MNVPKLRFKEFSDEYKYRNLSDISTLIKDGTHGTHENYENGIPLLSAKDINNNKINIPENCRKISVDDYNKIYKNYLLKKDDILLTIVGSIGRTALYKNEKVAFQRSVATIRIDDNNNSNYIRQYIESPMIINQLNNMTNSSAQGGVYLSSLSKLNFDIPRKEEQLKIANFLSLLDKKIELQSKKIEGLKLFKLCNYDNLFSNQTHEVQLKNISKIEKGKQLNNELLIENGSYYMLNGGVSPSGYTNEYNANENTITISEGGNSCGYVNFNKNKFWCGGHCYKVIPNGINNNYLYHNLKYNEKKIMDLRVGSGLPNIQKKDIENFKISIHNENEQLKISNYFDRYDLKIELEELKLNKLIELKKGLMQNMFV